MFQIGTIAFRKTEFFQLFCRAFKPKYKKAKLKGARQLMMMKDVKSGIVGRLLAS